uniref:Uncharacterized protein n=1 Tax=Romanomermis culicivorax TaxID=13658 RepID=A0A915JZW7_ROMCU
MNSVLELGEPAESWTEGVKRVFEESIKQPMDKLTKSTEGAKYNHDRCERTVQMQLYVMQKPQFTLIFVIFLVVNALFAIIGLAGPPITSRKMTTAKDLTNSTDLLMQMYKMNSPTLSTYCQQLWIIVKIVLIPISVDFKKLDYERLIKSKPLT